MCCYKVARLEVSQRGLLGARIERWGQRHALQQAFLHYNRQALCWMEHWIGLGIADVDGFGGASAVDGGMSGEGAAAVATEIATESNVGLAFSFSDETNPFLA